MKCKGCPKYIPHIDGGCASQSCPRKELVQG